MIIKHPVWSLCVLCVLLFCSGGCLCEHSYDLPAVVSPLTSSEVKSKEVATEALSYANGTVGLWDKVLRYCKKFSAAAAGLTEEFSDAARSIESAILAANALNASSTKKAVRNALNSAGRRANATLNALRAINQSLETAMGEFGGDIKQKMEDVASKAEAAATIPWGANDSLWADNLEAVKTAAEAARDSWANAEDVVEPQLLTVTNALVKMKRTKRETRTAIILLQGRLNNRGVRKLKSELARNARRRLRDSLDKLRKMQAALTQTKNEIIEALAKYDGIAEKAKEMVTKLRPEIHESTEEATSAE